MHLLSIPRATPVPNQEWRDFLLDGLLSASKAENLLAGRSQCIVNAIELRTPELEDSIAHFYTQSFFHFFGHAAMVPM